MPQNPADKHCFKLCPSCYKCEDKGKYAKCSSCSGRVDPLGKFDPYDVDSFCDCRNGILRHRTQDGRLIVRKFMSSPYGGSVKTDAMSEDERDWNAFIAEKREAYNDPNWDPIRFAGGDSTVRWLQAWQRGESIK